MLLTLLILLLQLLLLIGEEAFALLFRVYRDMFPGWGGEYLTRDGVIDNPERYVRNCYYTANSTLYVYPRLYLQLLNLQLLNLQCSYLMSCCSLFTVVQWW
jgi:hypothetical protein